jgi:YlmC/YmxH family sporulation protein
MRLSELAGKELVDVRTGTRMGVLGAADLYVDEESGRVEAILLAQSGFGIGRRKADVVIAWSAIVKVGPDMIILDSEEAGVRQKRSLFGTTD